MMLPQYSLGISYRAVAAILIITTMFLGGCTYIKFATRQGGYHLKQRVRPSQRNLKHMVTRTNFFVYGRLITEHSAYENEIVVAAFSDNQRNNEIVDINRITKIGSYYGLNLPPGGYKLMVLADLNGDQRLNQAEIVGSRSLNLDPGQNPQMVIGEMDINLDAGVEAVAFKFQIPMPPAQDSPDSLFYPKGSIRSLDDPIFSPFMATLGMYEPAVFLEKAPMMFYALEEFYGHKVPIVFVHGIQGSAADFKPIVEKLDRTRYQPLFFHYPSGGDLHQIANFFHRIFLSGKVIAIEGTSIVIVAHSMGGIIVREALNLHKPTKRSNRIGQFITLATPFGGHPAARSGVEHAPVALPSWHDLNPDSDFISELFRRGLPPHLKHHLFYATGPANTRDSDNPGDGVVPLSSQRTYIAQSGATQQYGFETSHTGILSDPLVINQILDLVSHTKSMYPQDHLNFLDQGGFELSQPNNYSPLERYAITVYGYYLQALVHGKVTPFEEAQEHFVEASAGRAKPTNYYETAWLKYTAQQEDQGPNSSK